MVINPITRLSANPQKSMRLQTTSPGRLIAQAILKSGSFVGVAHSTSGTVAIINQDGQRQLELGDDFSTDSGPDLFILLHRSANPQSYRREDYVSLGGLQQVAGSQRYLIPAEVELENFSSVVIWCRRFNVTFGYAPLNG